MRTSRGPDIFQRAGERTPVFVRFSTVAGNKGSVDLPRDVRGFAVKFYTKEGNWDLVGNNIPVFFIQDAIKFPDLVHAVKEEPDRGFPQAQSAHDTFWDFISLTPESMHMIMWVMSDRAIPRSLRMMEGFGVHTFRLVNEAGKSTYRQVPLAAEARLAVGDLGRGAEDQRRRPGLPPPRSLGGDRERRLPRMGAWRSSCSTRTSPTSSISTCWTRPRSSRRSRVPLRVVGRMVLDRNPDNFFAETEQVAFCTARRGAGHRLHQRPAAAGPQLLLSRHPAEAARRPEFHADPDQRAEMPDAQLPARRAHADARAQGPGELRAELAHRPDGPREDPQARLPQLPRAWTQGDKLRVRSEIFADHYSQARQFFVSQTEPEQNHIVAALTFELSKVETEAVRLRMLGRLANIDADPGERVAAGLGYREADRAGRPPAKPTRTDLKPSPALSILAKASRR